MSSQTTNLHLAKPDYSEAADIAVINSDMDLIDNYAGSTTTSLSNTQSSLAYIVGNTNTTGGTLSVGTYVYVKGHNTINEGLRKVTASIANNGNITTSNTTTCTGGGINDAYNSLNSKITGYTLLLAEGKTTGWQTVNLWGNLSNFRYVAVYIRNGNIFCGGYFIPVDLFKSYNEQSKYYSIRGYVFDNSHFVEMDIYYISNTSIGVYNNSDSLSIAVYGAN